MTSRLHPAEPLDEARRTLRRWQDAGMLDSGEVSRIEAAIAAHLSDEAADRTPARPAGGIAAARSHAGSLVVEALGYAGSVLIVAAIVVLLGPRWAHLALGARIAMTLGAALLTTFAGRVADPSGPAGARLRGLLWAVATGLGMAGWALLAGDGFGWQPKNVVLFAAALASVQAVLLWWLSRLVPLHLVTFATLAAVVGSAASHVGGSDTHAPAIALWGFGLSWLLLGVAGRIGPRQAAVLAGSALAAFAAMTTTDAGWGTIFAVATAAGILAFAVWRSSLALLAVGCYALLSAVPRVMQHFFPGSASVAIGLLLSGAILVAGALQIARHRSAGAAGR